MVEQTLRDIGFKNHPIDLPYLTAAFGEHPSPVQEGAADHPHRHVCDQWSGEDVFRAAVRRVVTLYDDIGDDTQVRFFLITGVTSSTSRS